MPALFTRAKVMERRHFLYGLAASLAVAHMPVAAQAPAATTRKGRITQGVTRGVFARGVPLDDCCREAARLGVHGFDLIGPPDWATLRKYGLVPSISLP